MGELAASAMKEALLPVWDSVVLYVLLHIVDGVDNVRPHSIVRQPESTVVPVVPVDVQYLTLGIPNAFM